MKALIQILKPLSLLPLRLQEQSQGEHCKEEEEKTLSKPFPPSKFKLAEISDPSRAAFLADMFLINSADGRGKFQSSGRCEDFHCQ